MSQEARRTVGIDFGTTNSTVALADGNDVRMVRFPSSGGETPSYRSLLYFERGAQTLSSRIFTWTGPEAVERYLTRDTMDDALQGRLIQSLKSHLSDRTLTGTQIFRRKYLFGDLVAKLLSDLRTKSSALLGFDVKHAVAGRPVMFVGARTEDDNAYAEERLKDCFRQAGFESVRFIMEPVAAAHSYESSAATVETVLIGDFGGGTTDFSLMRMHPGRAMAPRVLASTGVGLAGDALDARIVRKLVSPALGSTTESRSFGKLLPALPAWVFSNLERWHTLSFLRTHEVRELLRVAEKRALEPEKIAALRTVIDHDLGYQLHQAVQNLKVNLSLRNEAHFHLATEAIQLEANVTRAMFEEWIAPELAQIEGSLDEVLVEAGIDREKVDRVVLTGGTSLVPAVRKLFTSRFGETRVHTAEVFTSVARGLALIARMPTE